MFFVTYELKEASLAVEPKNVLVQSRIMTQTAAKEELLAKGISLLTELTFNKPKQAVAIPQRR